MEAYSGIDLEYDKIKNMINKGLSAYKIAKQTKYSKSTVLRFIKRHNLKNQNKCKVDKNNLLKNKTDTVFNLYKSGMSQNAIAKKLNCAQSSIHRLIEEYNINKNDWKYSVNESYFNQIDTPNKAYILGWYYSDGCVDNNGKFRIQIQKQDEDILYKIKNEIEYSGPIYEIPPPKKYPHRKAQVALCINRKSIAQDLIKWGCLPNKSLILEYPKWIDAKLESHFVRGVFDGDGSVNLKRGKYLNCSITTTNIFNLELQERLKSFGVNSNIYYRRKNKNTCSLQITKTNHCNTFLNWIYKDAELFLERKRKCV